MQNWTQGLNEQQREAVLHNEGPLLILAGAGSGKTTVLVSRTGRLVDEGVAAAESICVLTFTNKAARELKERLSQKLGPRASEIWAGTFHSFGLQLLRKNHKSIGLSQYFGVIDASDSQAILKELLKNIRHSDKEGFDLNKLLSVINSKRGNSRFESLDPNYDEMAEMLLPKYSRKLETLGVVDFEDLLLKPTRLFHEKPEVLEWMQERFQHLMIDEFQDTNALQMKLVKKLAEKRENIVVVGDDDQSIYGWRGAIVENILNFPRIYRNCRVVKLEKNYRSTPAILGLANAVIEKNSNRHAKILRPHNVDLPGDPPELFVYESDSEEVEQVVEQIRHFQRRGYAFKDIAILYRSNSQGGLIEGEFRRQGIPYAIKGGMTLFDRKEAKDVLAYLRSSLKPHEVSLRRILNTPPRGIGDVTVEKLKHFSDENKVTFQLAAQRWQNAGVNENSGRSIDELFTFLREWPDRLLNSTSSVGEALLKSLRELGYRDDIYNNCKKGEDGDRRWMVIEIFSRVLDSFIEKGGRTRKTLKEFIDRMELRDPIEGEEEKDQVQLLTLHACKGLEFPVVILIGVEEDIIPHRTLGSDVDEERRLFYVGVTRAKEKLVLSRVRTRKRFGKLSPATPSRFLVEIPEKLIHTYEGGARPLSEDERKALMAQFLNPN